MKVFISYRHDSQAHKEKVLALANRLRKHGIDCNIDQYEDSPREGWEHWMLNQVEAAKYVLIVCTQQYDRSFRVKEETGKGKGVTWEGGVIMQELYDAQGKNSKFIPVIFTPQDSDFIPKPLKRATFYSLDKADGYERLYRRLTNQPFTPKPTLGKLRPLQPREPNELFQDESIFPTQAPICCSKKSASQDPEVGHTMLKQPASIELKHPTPSNYNQDNWVDRVEVTKLLTKLNKDTRVLWITGISGIGKTALGGCLFSRARELGHPFKWINLEITEANGKQFATYATDLLIEMVGSAPDSPGRSDSKHLSNLLIQELASCQYWIQIDSLEYLLNPEQPTEFKDSYWVTFLTSCLNKSNFESRLVLTAQSIPDKLKRFRFCHSNWEELPLRGLLQEEQHLDFFKKYKLDVESLTSIDKDNLKRIAKTYEGHPLGLRVIATQIIERFGGDFSNYWEKYSSRLERDDKELQDIKTKTNENIYLSQVENFVRNLIKESLEQLTPNAQNLLMRSAVFRRPVPEEFWLKLVPNRQESQVALDELNNRTLIETKGINIRLHNLIRSLAYDMLKGDLNIWRSSEQQAAKVWLEVYIPDTDAPKLETVRHYLEAFHHYCAVGDWQNARAMFCRKDPLGGEALSLLLQNWSYYQEVILLSRRLEQDPSVETKILCTLSIGYSYHKMGRQEEAVKQFEKALKMIGDTNHDSYKNKRLAWLGLGNSYTLLGEYKKAWRYFYKTRYLSIQMNDPHVVGVANTGLGRVYMEKGKSVEPNHKLARPIFKFARSFFEEALRLPKKYRSQNEQAYIRDSLGTVLYHLELYDQAFDCHQQSLEIYKKIGARQGVGYALSNLGLIYYARKNYDKAINCYQKHLDISQEIGDRRGVGIAKLRLGKTLYKPEDYSKAEAYLEVAIEIFHDIGDFDFESKAKGILQRLPERVRKRDLD